MTTATRRRTNAVSPEAIALRRAEILEGTADLIVAAGVAGTTFAALSQRTGFSIGMLQHYFRTRDQLIDACIDQNLAVSQQRWQAIAVHEGSALDRLGSLLDYAAEDNFASGWGFWLELLNAARLDEGLRGRVNEGLLLWAQLFHDAVADVIDAGQGTATRPVDEVVQALVGLADGLAIQVINSTYGMTPERMRHLLHTFIADELDIALPF